MKRVKAGAPLRKIRRALPIGRMFQDRQDSGQRLAKALVGYAGCRPVVLALPRGGVPVAYEIAKSLGVPLDLVLVRKIGAPGHSELAVGAVVDGESPEVVVNEDVASLLNLPEDYVSREAARQLQEIDRRRQLYLGGRPPPALAGRTVIVVDDGIATGATALAALQAIRRAKPEKLILAVPVAPSDSLDRLRAHADELVCLATPGAFGAISLYYADFHQVADDEVTGLLEQAHRQASGHAA